jgi:hypothetical protein
MKPGKITMKTITILISVFTCLSVRAQVVVEDPGAIEQLVLQLARQGDPALIQQLAGLPQLRQSLGNTGVGLTLQQIQQAASGFNAFYYDGNGLYRPIQSVIVTPDGASQPRVEQDYRKYDALTAASTNYQSVHNDTETRRSELRQQIRATIAKVQSATTEAETTKLKAVLEAQSAELAAIDRERDAAATRVLIQDAENRNDKARQEHARAEDRAAAFAKANENLGRFLAPDTAPVLIPSPAKP